MLCLCGPLFQTFLSSFLPLLLPYFVFSFSLALFLAPLLLLSCEVAVSFCSKPPILNLPFLRPHFQWPVGTQEKQPRSNSYSAAAAQAHGTHLVCRTFENWTMKLSEDSTKVEVWGKFWVWFNTGPLSRRVWKVEPQRQLSKHENLASLPSTHNIAFLTSTFNKTLQYYLSNLIVRTSLFMFYLFLNNSETQDRKLQYKYWSTVNLQVL